MKIKQSLRSNSLILFFSFQHNDTKKSIDKFLAYNFEEVERVHRLQKDQELDKEQERRHRERKEHSVRPGKERLSKERSHKHYGKEEKEKHKSKRSKDGSSHGNREGQPAEASEKVKSRENERKKHNLGVSIVKTLKHYVIAYFNCGYIIIDKLNNKVSIF